MVAPEAAVLLAPDVSPFEFAPEAAVLKTPPVPPDVSTVEMSTIVAVTEGGAPGTAVDETTPDPANPVAPETPLLETSIKIGMACVLTETELPSGKAEPPAPLATPPTTP